MVVLSSGFFHSFHIGASCRVYANDVAFVDKKRDIDFGAGL